MGLGGGGRSWMLRGRAPGLCPLSLVLEQPPSPGTAAWTLSGVSIVAHPSHTLATGMSSLSWLPSFSSKIEDGEHPEESHTSVCSLMCLFIHPPPRPLAVRLPFGHFSLGCSLGRSPSQHMGELNVLGSLSSKRTFILRHTLSFMGSSQGGV